MARMLRLHVPGGFYHTTLRGNHRQPIFFEAADRDLLERIVAQSLTALGARLHAYCWMTNHIHMLLQVAEMPLGRLMLRIASKYARIVQSRMQTTGHFFERRYHALVVDADGYLLTLLRYIHLNPVRAGLVHDPAEYPWSSHRNYSGMRNQEWLTTGFALRVLAQHENVARARYLEFMGLPAAERWGTGILAPNERNAQILGSDDFVSKVCPSTTPSCKHQNLEDLLTEAAGRFGVARSLLHSPSRDRRLCSARAWIVREAVESRIASVSTVARELRRSEAALRQLMRRHAARVNNE